MESLLSFVKEGHVADYIIVDSLLNSLRCLLDSPDKSDLRFEIKIKENLDLLKRLEVIDFELWNSFSRDIVRCEFKSLKKWIKGYLTDIAPASLCSNDDFFDI